MPWIVQRQILTSLIGLPQRYINSTVTNMRHRRWRGNWLSPVPLLSFKIKCDFFFPLRVPLQNMRVQTLYYMAVTSLIEWRTECTNKKAWWSDLTSETEKDRKRKQSREAEICWEGWSQLRVDMRKNMENLFVRVRWTDLWGQITRSNSAVGGCSFMPVQIQFTSIFAWSVWVGSWVY